MSNLVVTTLLTHTQDPERGLRWDPRAELLSDWAQSLRGCEKVVLADELDTAPDGVQLVRVPCSDKSPYVARWDRVSEYLSTSDARFVWVTDGTDVTMLREPWEHMNDGVVYVGSETENVGFWWMRGTHKAPGAVRWIEQNSRLHLVNAGLLGGDRETVLAFVDALRETLRVNPDTSDMAAFNMVAHSVPHITGPKIHTVFKAYRDNGLAWWMHK